MNKIQRIAVNAGATALFLAFAGCTVIGAGIGAAAGSGSTVGMLGGAVIGGVVGHEIAK